MDDLFAPPGHDWQPVSPALARLRRTLVVGLSAVALVALVVLGLLLDWPVWTWLVPAVAVVALAVWGWWLVGRNARWWGYAEQADEDLYIKHGALFRTLVVVPYGRMQYVDVQSGPLEQAFQIASVHLHTASPGHQRPHPRAARRRGGPAA